VRARQQRAHRDQLAREPRQALHVAARRERRRAGLDRGDDLVERRDHAIAVLAKLQRAQPKSEQLDGAQQAPHRARDLLAAAGAHARLDQREIGAQRRWSFVAALRIAGGEPQPTVDEGQLAAVRLRFLARSDGVAHVGQLRGVAFDRRDQLRRDDSPHRVLRQARLQRLGCFEIARQHEPPRLLVGGDDRIGRDVGVAVTVAADPAA
jgi:hypothetical protein